MVEAGREHQPGGGFDLVVVGSGIAGLFATVRAARAGMKVALVSKATLQECSSRYAQGGIAAALDPDDSPELHALDTLEAGRGLCDPEAVRVLVEEGPDRVRELVELGVRFDTEDGVLALGREAAHSRARIVHARGDATGEEVEELLARRASAAAELVLEEHSVRRLLVAAGGCWGVETVSRRDLSVDRLRAPAVLLATGGMGRCFRYTSNPWPSTGDGVWLAHQAGAEIANLEFIQFHPTVLTLPGAPSFLISEAVRGEGAHLVDDRGHRFLFASDPAGELAGRDVTARAVAQHMLERGLGSVWLDLRPMGPERARLRFPGIASFCTSQGIDITRELVPVAPAAHFQMGGVRTDLHGATTLAGLYAAGEVASTGIHGANRLASNSLLESLVFSARAAEAIAGGGRPGPGPELDPPPAPQLEEAAVADLRAARARIRSAMWEGAGLVRDASGLEVAAEALAEESQRLPAQPLHPGLLELRSMVGTSQLLVEAASLREESRGAHYRSDFPEPSERFRAAVLQRLGQPARLSRTEFAGSR